MSKKIILLAAAILLFFCLNCYPENIDPNDDGSQYAYGENVGWLNFEPDQGPGVTVMSSKLTGYVWAENIGWINLDPNGTDPNTGVNNDGTGVLSGHAWGENVGWINFSPKVPGDPNHYGVTVDSSGCFDGWAWGENIGWINFRSVDLYGHNVKAILRCVKKTAPEYSDWITFGKPDCWCYPHHCQGDIDGEMQFYRLWVFTDDLDIFKANFGKEVDEMTARGICADLDNKEQFGLYRVFTDDLDIFKVNFGQMDHELIPLQCDPNYINFWTSP